MSCNGSTARVASQKLQSNKSWKRSARTQSEVAYWDVFALLKLYLHEADSPVYRVLAARSARPLITSAIADTEILCAFSSQGTRGRRAQRRHSGAAEPRTRRRG